MVLLREIVLTYLLAVLIWRFTLFLGRVVLVPGGDELDDPERYRVAPISTERARFWQRRLGTFVGYCVWLGYSLLTRAYSGFRSSYARRRPTSSGWACWPSGSRWSGAGHSTP